MLCQGCQHENPDGARFCNSCGESLAAICPACDQQNPDGSRFCNECGAALTAAAPAEPPRSRPSPESAATVAGADERISDATDPRSYTPRHLADRILTQKSALEGERKHVTVLFADLFGSSELAHHIGDPEEMHSLLDPAFQLMLAEVHRVEGRCASHAQSTPFHAVADPLGVPR